MVRSVLDAKTAGFTAAKLELLFDGPYANLGVRESDERVTEVIAAVRAAVGTDFTLMVDVGYAFDSVDRAAKSSANGRSTTCSSWRRRSGATTSTATPSSRGESRSRSPRANGSRRATSSRSCSLAARWRSPSQTSGASVGSPRRCASATSQRAGGG